MATNSFYRSSEITEEESNEARSEETWAKLVSVYKHYEFPQWHNDISVMLSFDPYLCVSVGGYVTRLPPPTRNKM